MNGNDSNNFSSPIGPNASTPVGYAGGYPPSSPSGYTPYQPPEKEEINLKPHKSLFRRPGFVGTLFALIGLLVGGLGCFAIMKMVMDSKECDCPTLSAPLTADALNTNFLNLELDHKNIIYSPLSIRYGLSLLAAGAAGDTKTQITNILGEEDLPTYENIPDVLSIANAAFIRASYQNNISPAFVKRVTRDFDAGVFYDSFTSSENMDAWVAGKTFGLINTIGVQPTPDTRMVLANALAIQMEWQHKFETDNTFGMTFYKENNSEMLATMMRMDTASEDISYYLDDNVTLLKMPLMPTEETALNFVAVMPAGSLTDYINNLDSKTIMTALENSTPASTPQDGVKIYIPKFKFDYELKFKEDLETLGMTNAFDSSVADFSKMTTGDSLYVSDAVHKANIDFSEEGIKAAAVTAFAMKVDSMVEERVPQPVVINIDKPFYFMIYDSINNTVWFSGAVFEPNLWDDDAPSYQTTL